MRTILVAIFLILYTIFSIPMYFIVWVTRKCNQRKSQILAQTIVAGAFRIILWLSGVKITVKGKENILHNQAALYVYNHRSFFDVVVGYALAPKPTSFISKIEIKKVPMVAQWMYFMDCLFLDRKDIRQGMKTILAGIDELKGGQSIFIAPEGTRNHGEELLPFHEASFKLADKSKCPIVPVAMNQMDEIFEKHLPWIHKAHVIVEFCKPIYMTEMDREEKKHVGVTTREIIEKVIEKNKAEL